MKSPKLAGGAIALGLCLVYCDQAPAQEIASRFRIWRIKRALPARSRRDRPSVLRPLWRAYAEVLPTGENSTASAATQNPAPVAASGGLEGKAPEKHAGVFYADASLGFDRKTTVVSDPVPREVRVRRTFRVINLAGEFPLGAGVRLLVGMPYISQSETVTGSSTRRGDGVGDATLLVERQFRESGAGVGTALGVGIVLPTGKDPFTPDRLATGNGFYEPFVRASVRKLLLPVQVFGSVNYGQGLPRKEGGQTLHQPASFGGEVGFDYAISPEFTASTSVSASQVSSPFLDGAGSHVAYLSQSLAYASGDRDTMRLAVDAGLTDDSLDAYLTLSLRRQF